MIYLKDKQEIKNKLEEQDIKFISMKKEKETGLITIQAAFGFLKYTYNIPKEIQENLTIDKIVENLKKAVDEDWGNDEDEENNI